VSRWRVRYIRLFILGIMILQNKYAGVEMESELKVVHIKVIDLYVQ